MRRGRNKPLTPERYQALRDESMTHEQVMALVKQEVWLNNLYVVLVERRPEDGSVCELSIRRKDREPSHDWRHFQRIKNEIAGAEVEALELYPAMSRLMDTANQYYLWCQPPGEKIYAGYEHGSVKDTDDVAHIGAVQRKVPQDWLDYEIEPV